MMPRIAHNGQGHVDVLNSRYKFTPDIWSRWRARNREDSITLHLRAGIAEFRALLNNPRSRNER